MATLNSQKATFSYQMAISSFKGGSELQLPVFLGGSSGAPPWFGHLP